MGLDMYLTGQKYLSEDWENPANNATEDGYTVKERNLRLGYWRKHPDLHGYIVREFAEGVDECQEIPLDRDALVKIVGAVRKKQLPKTSGFFFGESDGSEDEETIQILEKAVEWLDGICVAHDDCAKHPTTLGRECAKATRKLESRSIVYRASW